MSSLARVSFVIASAVGSKLAAGVPVTCSPVEFGSLAEDPLTISGEWDLPAACTLDFGDRAVILEGTLRAEDLTLRAGDLVVQSAGRIEGGEGVTTLILSAGAVHAGSGEVQGALVNDGPHGGGIVVEAGGSFLAVGRLQASSIDASGSGGFINVQAGQGVTLGLGGQAVALAGAVAELGGEVAFASTGASVDLDGEIHVTGGSYSPGAVTVAAATSVRATGLIGVAASCGAVGECSLAGVVRITAGTDLTLDSDIDAAGTEGGASSTDGTGGQVILDAGGAVLLRGMMSLGGDAPGRGGTFRARLDGDYLQLSGATVDVSGVSVAASGGTIEIESGGNAVIDGGLIADGGIDADAGTVLVAAELDVRVPGKLSASANYPTGGIEVVSRTGAIEVTGGIVAAGRGPFGTGGAIGLYSVTGIDLGGAGLDASGNGPEGVGGEIRLDTFGPLHASPGLSLVAAGDSSDPALGLGGTAELIACGIVLEEEGLISATGGPDGGGGIFLTASDSMEIAAVLDAADGGLIELRHRPGAPPDLSGSSITPDPIVTESEVLTPCFVLPGQPFSRGDCNTRDGVNISDPINLLNSLFLGVPDQLPCEKACDANDDGQINISDPIKLLNALFVSQGEVLPPPLSCGLDETEDSLTCEEFTACP